MKALITALFGSSPVTSLLGYAAAAILIVQQMLQAGETNWATIVSAVLTGLIGRAAADASQVKKQ